MESIQDILNRAQQAQSVGNAALALQLFQQVLLQHPTEASLQAACGNLCITLKRYQEATDYFKRVFTSIQGIDARKALCYALQSSGNQAHQLGQFTLAAANFGEALQYEPDNAIYWYNLGNAQRELGKIQDAVHSFQQSIHFDVNDADAYNNLGNVQRELGQLDSAIANYQRALTLNPNLHHALVHLIHQKQHICDWQNLDDQIAKVRSWINHQVEAQISPFAFLAMPSTTAQEQKECATRYITQNYQSLLKLRESVHFQFNRKPNKKIKLGYLSADFRLHPLAFLITELIEQHDRNQFEVVAYAYGKQDQTPTRKRLMQAFDHFIDINHLNTVEAAQKIYADQIDILIDLTGLTQNSRTDIIVLKPAPNCVSWLGYPGTMGVYQNQPLFDYLIADHVIAPDANNYCEKLLYLPCYQPNSQRAIGPSTTKISQHLPGETFVFCCFNQTFKITTEVFAIWMRLLKRLPNSVLWLLECNQWAKINLQNAAINAGVDSQRLVFAPRVSSEIHLERHQHADLFLDTLPYNAHTTASDALWMGLPVLTCMGETFPSRVAASLLQHMKLPELICDSFITYEQKAYDLANNPYQLTRIRKKLFLQKETSNLFNVSQFAGDLESSYLSVFKGSE